MTKIAVIGAGVIGLSTALQLQKALPQASVTIVADKFDKDTTSYGVAGIFRPTAKLIRGLPPETVKAIVEDSFDYFHRLAHSEDAVESGTAVITIYNLMTDPAAAGEDPLLKSVVYSFAKCTEKELRMFPGGPYPKGFRTTTLIAEPKWLLPYWMDQFRANGGALEKRKVFNLEELAGKYDLVVNCTGLGSRELLNDSSVRATRGQLIRVSAPWIHTNVMIDANTYVIAGRETVTVGGTRQQDDYSLENRDEDEKAIWERVCKIVPSLKKAKRLYSWAGLRPNRDPVRLEKEVLTFGRNQLKVVHNYGHGANGVAMSWGSGRQATKLALEMLKLQAKL